MNQEFPHLRIPPLRSRRIPILLSMPGQEGEIERVWEHRGERGVFPFLQAAGGGLPRRRLPPHAAGAAGSGLPRRRLPPHAARTRLPPRAAHRARHARAQRRLACARSSERERGRKREIEGERERENLIWGRAVGCCRPKKGKKWEERKSIGFPFSFFFFFNNIFPKILYACHLTHSQIQCNLHPPLHFSSSKIPSPPLI